MRAWQPHDPPLHHKIIEAHGTRFRSRAPLLLDLTLPRSLTANPVQQADLIACTSPVEVALSSGLAYGEVAEGRPETTQS